MRYRLKIIYSHRLCTDYLLYIYDQYIINRLYMGRKQPKGIMVSTKFLLFLPLILLPIIGTQAIDMFCLDAFSNTTILNDTYHRNVNGALSSSSPPTIVMGTGFTVTPTAKTPTKFMQMGFAEGN